MAKEISGSQGCSHGSLLDCHTLWTCRWVLSFRRSILPPSSVLKRWYPPTRPHGITTQKTNIDKASKEFVRELPCCELGYRAPFH
jgi:hypothetical protein